MTETWNEIRQLRIERDKLRAEIERLQALVGIESTDLDLDWNRLRSGDNRALLADHQDVFDMVAGMRDEIEWLRNPEPCWWVHADSDFYESQCGGVFQFTDGGPHDNAFTHCPFCGKPLEVGVQEEDDDE
jgi:hypothetical protein